MLLIAQVEWVQTARFKDGSVTLLKDMEPLTMEKPDELPHGAGTVIVDTAETFQEILGFGGAFTEATAINWKKLSKTFLGNQTRECRGSNRFFMHFWTVLGGVTSPGKP